MTKENAEKEQDTDLRPPVDIIDWLIFVPFALSFTLILLVLEVLHRTLYPLGGEAAIHRVNVAANRLILLLLKCTGARFTIKRCARLEPGVPYVIVSNHQSLFDIPLTLTTFWDHRPRYVAKIQLGRWIPGVAYNLRKGGNALIDRSSSSQAIREIARLGRRMRDEKFAVVVFAEGTRARNGVLKPFKMAGVEALLKIAPEAKIVPVSINGSWKLQAHRYGPMPRGVRITMVIGEPIDPSSFSSAGELGRAIQEVVKKNQSSGGQ